MWNINTLFGAYLKGLPPILAYYVSVSLTKTIKKGMELKHKVVEKIRKSLEEFDNLYVFTCNNMRNTPLKEVRDDWKGSRYCTEWKNLINIIILK